MQKDSRRWNLRQRTAQKHQSLDAFIGDFNTEERYRSYLVGMAAFRLAVEPITSKGYSPVGSSGYRPSVLLEEILTDLSDLGLAVPPPVRFQLPQSQDAILGALYVLEGSSIGAQLLIKRAGALGYRGDHGARHLARQTASLESWRNYLIVLEGADPFDMVACADAALDTFDVALTAFGQVAYA